MYAAVMCPNCGRNRIIDLESESTVCPYCSVRAETKGVRILHKGRTAREVKDVLNKVTGPPEPQKRPKEDKDPMSTLEYRYGRAKSADRPALLAEGLTRIKGTFTQEDVEMFEPGRSEKMIKMMTRFH